MPRQLRIQYPGAMYHVMCRGNRRQDIFLDDVDRQDFLKTLRRGWCLGSREFKKQQLEALEGQVGQHHFGELRLETAQAKAERIITEELGRLGWQQAELASRRKHDPAKLEIAARLRRETTLSVKQIATRLLLGTAKSASVRLLAAARQKACSDPAQRSLGI